MLGDETYNGILIDIDRAYTNISASFTNYLDDLRSTNDMYSWDIINL
jgi:heat shock protein HspQ